MRSAGYRRASAACAALFVLSTLTACAPRNQNEFTFILAGDVREFTPPDHPGPDYFAGACQAMKAAGPGSFMISPGDNDLPQRIRATLDAELGRDYVWYPVIGNHELETPDCMPYLREYNAGGRKLPHVVRGGPPGSVETCYAFDYGQAHFVVINQYYDGTKDSAGDGDVGDALYAWLEQDLAANHQPLVFVIGHEPTVAVPDIDTGRVRHMGDSLDQFPAHNLRFWKLLRDRGVTAFICGHTHNTSFAKINGVWQIDCGHARGKGDTEAPSAFVQVHVSGTRVRCDAYRQQLPGNEYKLTYSTALD